MKNLGKGIVGRIFGLAQKESVNIELVEKEYSLIEVIDSVLKDVEMIAREHGLLVVMDVDESIPKKMIGDRDNLSYVLKGILLKSIGHTEKGFIKCMILVQINGIKALLNIKVKDTGKAINTKNIDYNEFAQIQARLESMGSKLYIKNIDNQGNEIGFCLEQEIANKAEVTKLGNNRTLQVLVIDDTDININIFKSLLKNCNMDVFAGYSGEECLSKLQERKYDIVFLDHMMPELDGIQTIKKHRENVLSINRDTPIIVLTANVESGAAEEYYKAGFSGYLPKPIVFENLIGIIEENCC